MLPKQIAYILFGVIALLSIVFGYSIFVNYKENQDSEKKISAIISQFEEKFRTDSIYLANANKMLIDKISQHIIDSVSTAYEKKLKNALLDANKYKQLLIANNISIKSDDLIPNNNFTKEFNITTYSKLNGQTTTKKVNDNSFNITTISKIEKQKNNAYTNVTTYSKTKPKKEKNSLKNTYNITTYSKLNNSEKNIISKNKHQIAKASTTTISKLKRNNNLTHNNYILDHAENINDLDAIPIYKGCEFYRTKDELKNCFAINISKHIINKFNSSRIQNSELKKGLHKVRVLFVIDEHGKAKIGKLVGKWPYQIYKNIKFAVESVPVMKPGYSNNKAISVKYSLLIPFIIK